MARYTEADCKRCRREGTKLFLKGDRCTTSKCSIERRAYLPGQHGQGRKKFSEYGIQLREKQKVKRMYDLLEAQFHGYYVQATRKKGKTGEVMLSLLERRLDNVVYRMGIGSSRAQSRQIVNHGHITVNGITVNIPSYCVKKDDVIAVKDNKKENTFFKELRGAKIVMPKWLEFNTESLAGRVVDLPTREDIDLNIQERLIIELYSR